MTSDQDRRWLRAAIELSRRCSPVTTAYSVGAIIVNRAGHQLASGYSRDASPDVHAEESALAVLATMDVPMADTTLYSSLEPCGSRRSSRRTCAELVVTAGIYRVVFALREPPVLAAGHGAEILANAGVEVVEIGGLAPPVREINAHLLH